LRGGEDSAAVRCSSERTIVLDVLMNRGFFLPHFLFRAAKHRTISILKEKELDKNIELKGLTS
jgi:hypothetical protein